MIIGIDATNIKSDGGIVHLFELINNFKFNNSKIKKIIIWGNSKSLKNIKNDNRIHKIQIDTSYLAVYLSFYGNYFFCLEKLR